MRSQQEICVRLMVQIIGRRVAIIDVKIFFSLSWLHLIDWPVGVFGEDHKQLRLNLAHDQRVANVRVALFSLWILVRQNDEINIREFDSFMSLSYIYMCTHTRQRISFFLYVLRNLAWARWATIPSVSYWRWVRHSVHFSDGDEAGSAGRNVHSRCYQYIIKTPPWVDSTIVVESKELKFLAHYAVEREENYNIK